MIRIAAAFLRRDLAIAASYRSNFVLTAMGGLVTLCVFFFLGRAVGPDVRAFAAFRGGYFSFALVGVAVASALRALQTSFARSLRETQTQGSLEALLASPRSTLSVLSGLGLYPALSAVVRSGLILLAGVLVFGAKLELSWGAFLLLACASLLAFGALGLLSAAFVLAFKRGDPFSYLLDVASYLLSGVVYPVEVLPHPLRALSHLLPATWALEGLRRAALQGEGLSGTWRDALGLLGFSAVLWPLGAIAVWWARRHVERSGTLSHS